MLLIFKQALRRLVKSPGFTFVSVLMLALGIAMSTSTFSITNGALLRPLPFHDPGQLVRITSASPKDYSPAIAPGYAMDMRDQLADVAEFGLFFEQQQNVAEPGQSPERQVGMSVSANVLTMLGIQPELGRGFLPGEDKPNQPPVVLLTDQFWREHFGADRSVLGKVLRIETTNFTVVGVLPPQFDEPLVWYGCKFVTLMTVWPNWRTVLTAKWMSVMGRLRPGVSLGRAQVRLDAFARQEAQEHPVEMGADTFRVGALGTSFAGPQIKIIYWLVVGLAVAVLVIACANLGAVQLARTFARRNELAVRAALGASRLHIVATLTVESLFLCVAGTALGTVATYWCRAVIAHWLEGPLLPIDGRVIGFAVLAGVLATVCFGLIPAWLSTGTEAQALKEGSRGSTGSVAQNRLKVALIISQLGLALILVSTAASFAFGVRAFVNRDRGWRPQGLVAAAFHIPWDTVLKEKQSPQLARVVEQKLGAIAGVERVAVASNVILSGDLEAEPLVIDGIEAAPPGREPRANVASVDAAFFGTLGISLREGRLFPADWRQGAPPVAVISASTARHFWPTGSAIGKRIRVGEETAWREIIGVVSDATFQVGYSTPATPFLIYRPTQEASTVWYSFILQTHQPAARLEKPIRSVFSDIDPDIMVVGIKDVPQMLAEFGSTGPLNAILTAFAASGLVIALVGLYGVMSQFVAQRRREIGVRMALGADGITVITMVLARGARMLAVGGVLGISGSCVVTMLFRRALPELPMFGVIGDVLIGAALVGAGLVACYFPSARAARVNPVEVLRAE